MLSILTTMFGGLKATEGEQEIRLSGIKDVRSLIRDIEKFWKTTLITNQLFKNIGRNYVTFDRFFAVDVVYMLEALKQYKYRYTSIREINQIIEVLTNETWLVSTKPNPEAKGRLDFTQLDTLTTQPLSHQLEFMEQGYNFIPDRYHLRGMLLAAAPGSGKTIGTLTVAQCLHADRIFVICPKNALYRVWEDTIAKLYKEPQPYWIPANGKPYNGERICVIHYDVLEDAIALAKTGVWNNDVMPVVILDESHNMNEIGSMRTQLYLDFCKLVNSNNIIPASGTPIKALGAEAIPLLRALDPLFTPDVEVRFKKIFGKGGGRVLDILKNRIDILSFKIEKKVLNLAPPIIQTLKVQVPNSQRFTLPAIADAMALFIAEREKYYASRRRADEETFYGCLKLFEATLKSRDDWMQYDVYRENLKAVIATPDPRFVADQIRYTNQYEKVTILPKLPLDKREDFKETKTIVKYTALKIQGECLGRVLGRFRIECHVEMVPHINFVQLCASTEKKTVVFTSFVEVLEATIKHCEREKLIPLAVYGKNTNELANTVKRFESDTELNPLIATYNSLSTAVPLTMADTMVMINSPFRAYIYEQAISRIHRLGADTQTYVWQCVLDTGEIPNISTRTSDILKWSTDQVEKIMGIKSPFSETELESLESSEPETLDDNQWLYKLVSRGFEQYGIQLDQSEFKPPVKAPTRKPAFMAW